MVGEVTRYQAGQSGNPGGIPRNGAVSALARRYTVDAVRALVEVARLPATGQHSGAKVTAAVRLLEIGYPGLSKGTGGDLDLVQMHLLAVSQVVPADQNSVLNPEPDEEAALLERADRPGMLPAVRDELPDEALPLWEMYRAQRDAPEIPPDDANPGWERLPWKEP